MMSGSSAHEYVLKEYTTRVIRPRAQDIFSLIKRVAREEILPKFRNLDASEVAMKRSKTDLVIVADKAAEEHGEGEAGEQEGTGGHGRGLSQRGVNGVWGSGAIQGSWAVRNWQRRAPLRSSRASHCCRPSAWARRLSPRSSASE